MLQKFISQTRMRIGAPLADFLEGKARVVVYSYEHNIESMEVTEDVLPGTSRCNHGETSDFQAGLRHSRGVSVRSDPRVTLRQASLSLHE